MTHGCHSTERKPGYYVIVRRYRASGQYDLVQQWIEDRMSQECQYDRRADDAACVGCPRHIDTSVNN